MDGLESYDELVDNFSDVMPELTAEQLQRLNDFWDEGDIESCYFLLHFYAKQHQDALR